MADGDNESNINQEKRASLFIDEMGQEGVDKRAETDQVSVYVSQNNQKDGVPVLQNEKNSSPATKKSAKDFVFGKMLGEGSFSTVFLAKDIHTSREYAIKVCEKKQIVREKKIPYIKREKEALHILSGASPYFVQLYCTFQDVNRLYYVLSYAKNGELLDLIKRLKFFDLDLTRFYASEILLALEVLRKKKIIHRDIKPENILLDEKMHILITDFGSAKILEEENAKDEINQEPTLKRRNSFVGTANFVSPEVLTDAPVSYASDLWAFGCIIYQMFTGKHCFSAGSEYLIFQKVANLKYEFPENFDEPAKDLITKLLVIKGSERLGALDEQPYQSIRKHTFFTGVDWNLLGEPPIDNTIIEPVRDGDCFDQAEPGLNEKQMVRLLNNVVVEDITTSEIIIQQNVVNKLPKNIADVPPHEIESRLAIQERSNKYHNLVDGNLILKQGLIDKRKGLIPRRRMFLITLGPKIYYIEPNTMVKKGEVPWTEDLKVEVKNFKMFFIHTPNRTYNLEDPDGYAFQWCKAIEDVHSFYFPHTVANKKNLT